MYESTFVGLQGLAALHPAGSQALAAAEAALVGLLGGFAGQLKEVFGDDVLYQVGCGLQGDILQLDDTDTGAILNDCASFPSCGMGCDIVLHYVVQRRF